jgi:cardiolipin synthase C
MEGFSELRKRDVKVTILTNSLASNDEAVVFAGYAPYRPELLRVGVDLYELSATRVLLDKRLDIAIPGTSLGRLHAKTAAIDGSMIFIGSMNLDPRSDSVNTELGIIVRSPELAREVTQVIDNAKRRSAYRLKLSADGRSLEWMTTGDNGEVILDTEPDTTFMLRLQMVIFGPFIPEQLL